MARERLFSFQADRALVGFEYWKPASSTGVASRAALKAGRIAASPSTVDPSVADQFFVFQFSTQLKGPSILDSVDTEPGIAGSDSEPDVLVALEMLSFHIGESEDVEKDTRATMRINFGKDESSTDKRFDTVFWSIAAGLSLYDQAKKGKADPKEFKSDFHKKAFGNRPIEIPGGLGCLSFEVVKHKEPAWWQRTFGFLQSGTGKRLISVLGFPAITNAAIDVVDELLEKLTDSEPEPLFKSRPLKLALSKFARDSFTGGNPRVKIGALRQGFCILARGRDFATLRASDPVYYPTIDRLAPQKLSMSDVVAGSYDDPLKDVTYAVFRIGTRSTKLDPTFNYNA
jgi:hypothetical protein